MLAQRTISSIIFVLVIASVVYLGGWVFAILCSALAALTMFEFSRMTEEKKSPDTLTDEMSAGSSTKRCRRGLLTINVVSVTAATLCVGYGGLQLLPALLCLCFAGLMLYVLKNSLSIVPAFSSLAGVVYIALGFGSLLALRFIDGWYTVVFAFIISVGTDFGGYLFGSLFGKHKLSPLISPKKSWEGALGGIFLALSGVYTYNYFLFHKPVLFVLLVAILGSLLCQFGDLIESFIKRRVGVKDSGRLIPGHGGILDRFDSMLLLAPVLYACFSLGL